MSRLNPIFLVLCLAMICCASSADAQVCCVKGNTNDRNSFDFDGDGTVDQVVYDFRVNGEDIHAFVRTYLNPGAATDQESCASDMDDDNDIDDVDLVMFVDALLNPSGLMCDYVNNCLGGPLVYESPHPSEVATRIAYDNTSIDVNADPFELGKTGFFVPNTIIDRIARDFDDIVANSGDFDGDLIPDLTGEGPNQTLFAKNNLIVKIDNPFAANPDFECLNAFFGIDSSIDCNPPCACGGCCPPQPNDPPPTCTSGCVDCVFGCNPETFEPGDLHLKVLYLPTEGHVNIPLIAAMYSGAVSEIEFTDPNHCLGGVNGVRNIWRIENGGFGFWSWFIEHGFQDCFDGCDCKVLYEALTEETGEQPTVFLPPITSEALPGVCTFFATPTGACCVDFFGDGSFVECFELTMTDCFEDNAGAASINYLGNNTTCSPFPCGPTGACCVGTTCEANWTEAQCLNVFGIYNGDGTSCDPGLCEPFGACCEPGGPGCLDSTLADCLNNGGLFQGDGSTCLTPGICN